MPFETGNNGEKKSGGVQVNHHWEILIETGRTSVRPYNSNPPNKVCHATTYRAFASVLNQRVMSFTYNRTVRFRDTDAAGVVYFANVLIMCHEAYEDSLAKAGINLKTFFSNAEVAVPIIHSRVDFFQPMFCGDRLQITGIPQRLSDSKFEIQYQVIDTASPQRQVADALTRHVCIDTNTRRKIPFPDAIIDWLS